MTDYPIPRWQRHAPPPPSPPTFKWPEPHGPKKWRDGTPFVEGMLESLAAVRVTGAGFDLLRHVLGRPDIVRSGVWVEFGVFRGESLTLLAKARGDARVYGFDSFEGLPEPWRPGFPRGTFALGSPAEIPQVEGATIVKGLFADSFEALARAGKDLRPVTLAHIDSDIYLSATQALTWLEGAGGPRRLTAGSIIVFDELWNYQGYEEHEMKALGEAYQRGLRFEVLGSAYDKAAIRIL